MDGSFQSQVDIKDGVSFQPVVANNTLYITCTDGYVYAYAPTPTTDIKLTSPTRLGNGSFQFSFTNTPDATFSVWASTNLTPASSNWTMLGYLTDTSAGQYQFTDAQAVNLGRRFYRVSSP